MRKNENKAKRRIWFRIFLYSTVYLKNNSEQMVFFFQLYKCKTLCQFLSFQKGRQLKTTSMEKMKTILLLWLGLIGVNSTPIELNGPAVEPEYLDQLRSEGRYEEFSALLGLPDPKLAIPMDTGGRSELTWAEVLVHKELGGGDTLPSDPELNETGRQGLRFERYPHSKWYNKVVPYAIAGRDYSKREIAKIKKAIDYWNKVFGSCIKLIGRTTQKDYVYVFNGQGCYSSLGRRGNQQSLSLQKQGCLGQGKVIHEFQHAIGFAHEHNRSDRNDYVEILWKNISNDWKSEYQKTDAKQFKLLQRYDYYSIMHYPVKLMRKTVMKIKKKGISQGKIGYGNEFTDVDKAKIRDLYCR